MDYFYISGRSMEPILRKKKDIVVIENAKIADIKFYKKYF